MASLGARKAYFFTATLNDYWKDVIKTAFNDPAEDTITFFKAQETILNASAKNETIEYEGEHCANDKLAMKLLKARLRTQMTKTPVIIFTTKDHNQVFDEINNWLQTVDPSIQLFNVDDVDAALDVRDQGSAAQKGIYVVDRSCYRGFDLKLGMNSYVFVYDNARWCTATRVR